jgi:hypothetical protein
MPPLVLIDPPGIGCFMEVLDGASPVAWVNCLWLPFVATSKPPMVSRIVPNLPLFTGPA